MQEGQTTIIITTHYIEEARQASKVGMLRGGRLLAEASPDVLINRLRKNSLEEVFLHLCVRDQSPNPDVEGLEEQEVKASILSAGSHPPDLPSFLSGGPTRRFQHRIHCRALRQSCPSP